LARPAPHAEINYVLEGELHVEADGQTVVLGPGDCVRVAPGETGRYWAPTYARMLALYGANPEGAPTDATQYPASERQRCSPANSGNRNHCRYMVFAPDKCSTCGRPKDQLIE